MRDQLIFLFVFWLMYVVITLVWRGIEMAAFNRTIPSVEDSVTAGVVTFFLAIIITHYFKSV